MIIIHFFGFLHTDVFFHHQKQKNKKKSDFIDVFDLLLCKKTVLHKKEFARFYPVEKAVETVENSDFKAFARGIGRF